MLVAQSGCIPSAERDDPTCAVGFDIDLSSRPRADAGQRRRSHVQRSPCSRQYRASEEAGERTVDRVAAAPATGKTCGRTARDRAPVRVYELAEAANVR